jgi:hypothetical protein
VIWMRVPPSDWLDISQQTTVLAHAPGDGCSNKAYPGKPVSLIRLQTVGMENRLHHCGARNRGAGRWVRLRFEALFNPVKLVWRRKAMQDGRRDFRGTLRAGAPIP